MSGLKQSATVRTNSTKGSVCRVDVPAVTFKQLWDNYPSGQPAQERLTEDVKDKNGKVIAKKGDLRYSDQCAIKVSVALHRVSVAMKSFATANVDVDPGNVNFNKRIFRQTEALHLCDSPTSFQRMR